MAEHGPKCCESGRHPDGTANLRARTCFLTSPAINFGFPTRDVVKAAPLWAPRHGALFSTIVPALRSTGRQLFPALAALRPWQSDTRA